jgi:hypothetical protein
MNDIELLVTLCPSFQHFSKFAIDKRLAGIRLNSAMVSTFELAKELEILQDTPQTLPLYFDIKGRQPRVVEVIPNKDHLDLRLNHPVNVRTPITVLLKGGADVALLDHLEEGGQRLVFRGGPKYRVKPGESLYLRDPDLQILGDLFTDSEKIKIEKCREAGIRKWFLSYVEEQRDIDEFLELAGKDSEVWLKIESQRGLDFVNNGFRKQEGLVLVAARGDLYVEIERPHMIAQALRSIIEADPEACVGSRIMLSLEDGSVPSCSDFLELAWLYDVGYRRYMLCDGLCLREDVLDMAINAFESFRETVTP